MQLQRDFFEYLFIAYCTCTNHQKKLKNIFLNKKIFHSAYFVPPPQHRDDMSECQTVPFYSIVLHFGSFRSISLSILVFISKFGKFWRPPSSLCHAKRLNLLFSNNRCHNFRIPPPSPTVWRHFWMTPLGPFRYLVGPQITTSRKVYIGRPTSFIWNEHLLYRKA